MCGIAGIVALQSVLPERSHVERMVSALTHRGPDASGIEQLSDRVIFGHTRLSIFDLSEQAAQPMLFEHGAITYNGEVYNFQDISGQVQGPPLRSRSDTEVVLRLLVQEGLSALTSFDGFFAFAYFDGQSVFLVRDRFGKKPLYYTESEGCLYFASEMAAFKAVGLTFTLNPAVVEAVQGYRFSDNLSPFNEVTMLAPGSVLRIDPTTGKKDVSQYYSCFNHISHSKSRLPADSVDQLEQHLQRAVRKRLMADVPVGVICSGGLDSSLVAALAAAERKIPLFHVDVQGASEREYAECVAKHLDCPLHVITWTAQDFKDYESSAWQHFEYPAVHPNNVGVYAVARLARSQGISVLLGGEAADELFGGYVHHQRYYSLMQLQQCFGSRIVQLLSNSCYPAARWRQYQRVPDSQFEVDLEAETKKIASYYQGYDLPLYAGFLGSELLTYLQPLLLRGDKMGMAHGVEVRLPFLDQGVVEYALGLPTDMRHKKSILRTVAERYLPTLILDRKKVGFPMPQSFLQFSRHSQTERDYINSSIKALEQFFGAPLQ